MCEALPPTLEKNTMDLGGYMSICRSIFLFVFLAKRVGGQNKVALGKAEQVSVVFEQFFPNVRFDCLFFWHLGLHFGVLVALWQPCGVFLGLWVTLGLQCGTRGSIL